MSYILDALRKSEQERQPGAGSGPRGAVHNTAIPLPGRGWWLIAGIILLLGMLATALIFWRSTVSSVPAVPSTADPAAPAAETMPTTAEKSEKTTVPPPASPAKSTTPVRDLAEEAQVPAPIIRKPSPARTHGKSPKPVSSAIKSIPPMAAPAVADDVPLLHQMPLEFQRALPSLRVTIHVYAQDTSQRILYVNDREYHQGDQIEGGIRVEEIVPDGVILSYQGERFKLSRPR